ARPIVKPSIRLPSIDEPGLNLQLLRRKNLDPRSVEEPRRVGRNIRGLIGPVVKVVEAEETDIRQEDSSVDINSVQCIEVVAAVCLGKIAVSIGKVPLAARRAGVIARRSRRIEAELCH